MTNKRTALILILVILQISALFYMQIQLNEQCALTAQYKRSLQHEEIIGEQWQAYAGKLNSCFMFGCTTAQWPKMPLRININDDK